MLTDSHCRAAQPKDKAYKLTDQLGLHLFVATSGHKSWRYKYRFEGKEQRLVFGAYPEISLKAARDRRDEARRMLRAGIDPRAGRKQARVETARTFEAIARSWHHAQLATWSPVHAQDVIGRLEADVFPVIGAKEITKITVPDVLSLLRSIEERGAIETAHRVRQRISATFVFAIASGLAQFDPAAMVKDALRPIRRGRQPAFTTIVHARALLNAAEASPAHPVTKLASRMMALTAVRSAVIRGATWAEFEELDGREPIWRIPAARMKLETTNKANEGYDFIVPLASQSVAIIDTVRSLTGRGPYLFPNSRWAHKPMSENAIGYFYNRLAAFRGRHVPHGWRATFSTVMNELAIERQLPGDRAIIDLMLAHVPAGVEAAYNRAAYMPRRRALAQEWADMLLHGLVPAAQLIEGPRR